MPIGAPAKSERQLSQEVRTRLRTSAIDHLWSYIRAGLGNRDREPDVQDDGLSAAPPPGPPSIERPVMSAKEFLAGNYLEPGDVVLMTRVGGLFAWVLKTVNDSDFSHVAMVFQTPRHMDGLEETFLIETSLGGVQILSLSQFLMPVEIYADTGLPQDFVVGIKRLENPWARSQHRRIAAGRMLHFIENHGYNYQLLAALASKRTRNLYFRFLNSVKRRPPALEDFLKGGGNYMPKAFICSGFVQYAYVTMIAAAAKKGLMSPDDMERALEDVLFTPNATAQSKIEELLACTPKYLADTDKLAWKYLIHKGDVFHIASNDDAIRFFKESLPKRMPEAIPA